MASEVEICNGALQRLGINRITALSDDSKAARACNFVYAIERDALIRRHVWSFAKVRAQLAADSTAPSFGPTNYFTLPSDCLRVLLPNDPTTGTSVSPYFLPNGVVVDWAIEGRKIATSWSAPLEIVYLAQITDPNTMDGLFRDALSCRIALRICKEMTDSNQLKESIREDLKEILSEAKRVNAMENIAGDLPEDSFVTARW